MSWFYISNNEQKGPATDAELAELIQQGAVSAETQVWKEGMAEWKPYGEVALPAATPPPVGSTLGLAGGTCSECGQSFRHEDLIKIEGECQTGFGILLLGDYSSSARLDFLNQNLRVGCRAEHARTARTTAGVLANVVHEDERGAQIGDDFSAVVDERRHVGQAVLVGSTITRAAVSMTTSATWPPTCSRMRAMMVSASPSR